MVRNRVELECLFKNASKEAEYKDKILSYEKKINDILQEMKRLLDLDRKSYMQKDFSNSEIINMVDYLDMMTNHLQDCRDVLVGMWNKVSCWMYDLVEEYDKENKDDEK